MSPVHDRRGSYARRQPVRPPHPAKPEAPAAPTLQERVAAEITRRVAFRLDVLGPEHPDELAERLARMRDRDSADVLSLSRLPDDLADREPPRRHLGVAGFDYRNGRLVVEAPHEPLEEPVYLSCDPAVLDDDDLRAATRVAPETLPGYFLG